MVTATTKLLQLGTQTTSRTSAVGESSRVCKLTARCLDAADDVRFSSVPDEKTSKTLIFKTK